jgi:hypothetical protein
MKKVIKEQYVRNNFCMSLRKNFCMSRKITICAENVYMCEKIGDLPTRPPSPTILGGND